MARSFPLRMSVSYTVRSDVLIQASWHSYLEHSNFSASISLDLLLFKRLVLSHGVPLDAERGEA